MDFTDGGMQIDESDEHPENAELPRRESLEPDSNVTVESNLSPRKQFWQRVSTKEGMKTDESDEHSENA
jgi:hypothetical protein